MRDDMAQRAQRAAALQAELYARAPRLLSAEERDRFVSRLMDDARRRAQNREEIAAKAELERTRPAWEGLKGRQAKTPVPLRRGSKRR
ncbi:FAP190 [Auxenochlorella protothecoides x Auxenochlorella symbiontica]